MAYPTNPTTGDTYTLGTKSWTYNGTHWINQATFSTVFGGTPKVVFPSDWNSPDSNYTSSGIWSKGSLSDDDYVWFYLVAGGGGGRQHDTFAGGGHGGNALLLYGKASTFDSKPYVVGTGDPGLTSGQDGGTGGISSVALGGVIGTLTTDLATALNLSGYSKSAVSYQTANNFVISHDGTFPSGVTTLFDAPQGSYDEPNAKSSVFGGGGGGNMWHLTTKSNGISTYAGAGGDFPPGASHNSPGNANGADGVAPGGGGGATKAPSGRGGHGADGSVRVYHV
jgi:hypothetical protein